MLGGRLARLVRPEAHHHVLDHHINGRPDDHDHGGTAIIHITDADDDITVWGDYDNVRGDYIKLAGNDRTAALERVRAAIDAELGDRPDDTGQPDPAAVLGALCRWVRNDPRPTVDDVLLVERTARHRPD